LYFVLLGLLFGFVFPWSSEGFVRTWTQLAPGRTTVYILRKLADLNLMVFVGDNVLRTGRPDRIIKWFVGATSIAALGSVVQLVSGLDLYYLVTGLEPLDLANRMRGLNYEPRGLGLVATYGFALTLAIFARSRSPKWLLLILLHVAAIALSVSTSCLFAAGAGALTLLLFDRPSRGLVAAFVFVVLIVVMLFQPALAETSWGENWIYEVHSRLTTDKPGSAPGNFLESVALRMDLFDASAFLFLAARPVHFLVGTGPGLIGLASTDFVPQAAVWNLVWQGGEGLNTVPHTGLLRELSDAGAIGLILLFIFVRSSLSALLRLQGSGPSRNRAWGLARVSFLIAVAIYLTDASPLAPIEAFLGGIGLGAVLTVAASQKPASEAAMRAFAPACGIDPGVHAQALRIPQS
jgi:hypothetical protein